MRLDWIESLVRGLALPVERVVLFGSRARGEHVDWSDYDLAVVSPAFAGLSPVERTVAILRGWRGHRGLDAVGLTPGEIESGASALCETLRREGRVVWPAG